MQNSNFSWNQNHTFFRSTLRGYRRVCGSAWGQKNGYFPFHVSGDILASSVLFSFACCVNISRIFFLKKVFGFGFIFLKS